jgi:hypothetical protein
MPPEEDTTALELDGPKTDPQPATPYPVDERLNNRRLVELPSGAWVAVRKGFGRDIEQASIISGLGDGGRKARSPWSMFLALGALKGLFWVPGDASWREVTYEDLRDKWDDVDVFAVVGEVQSTGKSSPRST